MTQKAACALSKFNLSSVDVVKEFCQLGSKTQHVVVQLSKKNENNMDWCKGVGLVNVSLTCLVAALMRRM